METTSAIAMALISNINNVAAVPLGQAAQLGADAEGMARVLPDADARRVPVAAFQSSI